MNTIKEKGIVEPYLFFNGNCEQALDFYRKALGAEVDAMIRFKDSPEPPPPGAVPVGHDNKIMHASFRIGKTTIMASDGCETLLRLWRRAVRSACRWGKHSGHRGSAC
jgi:uncharacterized glyoxalase superfamily protein PhnB